MIQPLQVLCEVLNDEHIEQELRQIPLEQQQEVLEAIRFLLTDEIHFVLSLHHSINSQSAKGVH